MSRYLNGIDISAANGQVDWEQVKASGVAFAMLRAGYGRTADRQFKRNAAECERLGIPIGAYWFSYALSEEQAAREAEVCLNVIKQYRIELPVAYDFEYASVDYAGKNGVAVDRTLASDMARAFLRRIRSAGNRAVNYANLDFLSRFYDEELRAEFPLWLAQWPGGEVDLSRPPRPCLLWQYSSEGRLPGVSGRVDLDVFYDDLDEKEEEPMTGEEIYQALSDYLDSLPPPDWGGEEFNEAKAAGITDGSRPMAFATRYEAAIMAHRSRQSRDA